MGGGEKIRKINDREGTIIRYSIVQNQNWQQNPYIRIVTPNIERNTVGNIVKQ